MELNGIVLKVKRDLSYSNSREITTELKSLFDRGIKTVALDFSGTESIDSSGLGKLLLFSEKFREAGGELKIINVVSKDVVDLFQLINLQKFMKIEFKENRFNK